MTTERIETYLDNQFLSKLMEKKTKLRVLLLAVFLSYLLILTSIGPWLVQEVQQTHGIVPKYTYCSMLLIYGIIQVFVIHKYLDK
ncbi:hypothetical protein C5S39_01535 [Candidatus Methanophagaceae archaeon]|nr:hypothetical protein C5S39_01535 [Methanophagales archaeon]